MPFPRLALTVDPAPGVPLHVATDDATRIARALDVLVVLRHPSAVNGTITITPNMNAVQAADSDAATRSALNATRKAQGLDPI